MSLQHLANRMLTGFARVNNKQTTKRLVETEPGRPYRPTAACALGALALGYGIKPSQLSKGPGLIWWPDNEPDPLVKSPVDGSYRQLSNLIWNLNDIYGWSVERIAQWLANGPERPNT